MEKSYQPDKIEHDWQARWEDQKVFQAKEDNLDKKKKFYCLSMLPYPSGHLHMGHVRNYTIGDVISRYHRLLGENVLQPMGWDAFGLPAENAAIQHKTAPAKWTHENIAQMKKQLKRLGFSYDWDRELKTCDPDYYRWEQWLFLKLYEKNLVYKKESMVNWDPIDETVLANEQVVDGRGWRSGAPIERRTISQWFIKITDYADELLNELDNLTGWPLQVRTMQRNWIGRSHGRLIKFELDNIHKNIIQIYTTRPETIMGVTFLALAPQHPLALEAAHDNPAILDFIKTCQKISTAEAALSSIQKAGIKTPYQAIHPLTGEKLPVWIANYVLDYGTASIMGVPFSDPRDKEFAEIYHLPITDYIITDNAEDEIGEPKTQYRLRDWGVSRQRYWGTPIPIIYCDTCGTVPVPEKDLPVILPTDIQFTGSQSPLKHLPDFYKTACPRCHSTNAVRETDTFDTFVESSWYYARYTCPNQTHAMLDARANYWLPVDQYVGGIEHAVMHLLYARFFHKLMRDIGLIDASKPEPFTNLLTQGMVLKDGFKMSKSKGNTVDPDQLIQQYGCDTVRLFSLFAAPPELSLEWSDSGVEGASRFLKKLWHFGYNYKNITNTPITPDDITRAKLHTILGQILFDYAKHQFNTVVSGSMKILGLLQESSVKIRQEGLKILLQILYPMTPHICAELWKDNFRDTLGELEKAGLPCVDTSALESAAYTLSVQINGKMRGHITVDKKDEEKETLLLLIQQNSLFQKFLDNKTIKKIILIPNRLINIVLENE